MASINLEKLERRLELGLRVRAKRQERGWTTRQLGARAGVSDSFISRLETGATAQPRYADLELVADALGVSTFWLVRGYDPFLASGSVSGLADDPAFRAAVFALGDLYQRVTPADQEYVRKHLELITQQLRRAAH